MELILLIFYSFVGSLHASTYDNNEILAELISNRLQSQVESEFKTKEEKLKFEPQDKKN